MYHPTCKPTDIFSYMYIYNYMYYVNPGVLHSARLIDESVRYQAAVLHFLFP